MKADWSLFFKHEDDWALATECERAHLVQMLSAAPAELAARLVDGSKCRLARDVFREFARAFEFPAYFGWNWDAFGECLGDLDWLPASGYLVVVADALLVARNHPDFRILVEVMHDVARSFRTPATDDVTARPRAFHVIWQCAPGELTSLHAALATHGVNARVVNMDEVAPLSTDGG